MVKYPADWSFLPLKNCCTNKLEYGINAPAIPYTSAYPTYIRITDINDNGDYIDNAKKSVVTNETEKYTLRAGDIVLARTGASTGKSYLYNAKDGTLVYAGFLIRASIDEAKFNAKYIVNQLRTPRYWQWVQQESMRSGQPGINSKQYGSFLIPVPTKEEQDRIAEALTSMDTHISNLTELIEKKKAIRDGALEDLVSGRTRLDGFTGKWVTYPFQEYFRLLKNNTLPREKLSDSGKVGNIHYGDILIKYGDIVHQSSGVPRIREGVSYLATTLLQKNDVLIADAAEDETVGKVVQIGDFDIPLVAGLHTIPCRPLMKTSDGYLGFYMNSSAYHNQLLPYITGIKVSSVSRKSLKETVICVPEDIEEQCAIVEILTSMDDEIASLEAERDKMQQIKAGMMDDLLTGRVRLIG